MIVGLVSGEALAGNAVEILQAEDWVGWHSAAVYTTTTRTLRSLAFAYRIATKVTTKLRTSWTVQGITATFMSTVSKRGVWAATVTFRVTKWKATRGQIIL